MTEKLWCLLCPLLFNSSNELLHHMKMDHITAPHNLQEQALIEKLYKEISRYSVTDGSDKSAFECPYCFHVFEEIDHLVEHGEKKHRITILPEFIVELQRINSNPDAEANCTNCRESFRGLIVTKIKGKSEILCITCYEQFWGKNAAHRILMGTPENVVADMRRPVKH